MVMHTSKPCIKYESELDVSKMELVKLEKTVDGDSISKKVPIFSAQHGVEGLFLVIDHFM